MVRKGLGSDLRGSFFTIQALASRPPPQVPELWCVSICCIKTIILLTTTRSQQPPSLPALPGRSKERMKRKVVIMIVPMYCVRSVPPDADTETTKT